MPVLVVRSEGKLARSALSTLRRAGLQVVDVLIGTWPTARPSTYVRCWVCENGFVPPEATASGCSTVAVALDANRGGYRTRLEATVKGHVLWAPVAGVELLELVAGACSLDARIEAEAQAFQAAIDAECRKAKLTSRERQVFRGLAVGLTNKEIEAQLPIKIDAVKKCAKAIYAKLEVHGRAAIPVLVARARERLG